MLEGYYDSHLNNSKNQELLNLVRKFAREIAKDIPRLTWIGHLERHR